MQRVNEFEQEMKELVSDVEKALERFLPQQNGPYEDLIEAMRYSLLAGGKRIRAVLTVSFAQLFGLPIQKALPAACAVEMVHAYSLIHDDLPCMDDDDFRRGRPSCHKKFGEATALLAGDALLTLAFETLIHGSLQEGIDSQKTAQAALLLAQLAGAHGMVGGQVVDLASENQPVEEQRLLFMYEKKTSALIEAAVLMGCVLAGAPDLAQQTAKNYAKHLGLAFQVIDDILDVIGDEAVLGKPVGSDAENEKGTSVTLYGVEGAQRIAQQLTEKSLESLKALQVDSAFLCQLTEYLLSRGK